MKDAYQEFWQRISVPDGQIVWCDTDNADIAKTGIEMVMWELEVARDNIICFVDSLVWNRILGIRCAVSDTMRRQWISEAVERCQDPHVYLDQRQTEFWARKPKTGSWWDELFVEGPGDCINAILHHPVPDGCVKSSRIWRCD